MTKDLYLFNTLTRKREKFVPREPGKVGLYCCGPTVYNYAHIGNHRTNTFEDILARTLRYAGYEVNHVMNITDVGHLVSDGDDGEDKMEKGARREGKSAWDIAKYYTEVFLQDLKELNILEPQIVPRATDHIPEMIQIVEALEQKAFVYRTSDGLYFDTAKFPEYGKIGKIDVDNLEAGKRVDMREKRNPTDFALWKFSPENEQRQMEWDSPWGRGFPGWHIECSAMAMKYLGESFDIHCGGKDHITVHHPNEIAQSEAATGKKFVNYWLHGAFLNIESGKMAKSGDGFLTVEVLKKKGYSAIEYRFLLLQAHYRTELKFNYEILQSAKQGLQGIYKRFSEWTDLEAEYTEDSNVAEYKTKFENAIFDDLNMPKALAVFFEVLKDRRLKDVQRKHLALDFDRVFGLGFESAIEKAQVKEELPDQVLQLIKARDEARAQKDWQASDRLRADLEALGYQVLDTKAGTKVSK